MIDWKEAKDGVLAKLVALPRLGLVSDLDGTLSPIVEDPDAAAITERNRALLAALQKELALVALVSGRGAVDVVARVGLPELVVVGNHGLERWEAGENEVLTEATAFRTQLEAAKALIEELIEPGAHLEDKGVTLTLHYRQHADPDDYAKRIGQRIKILADAQGLRFSKGRMVFEFRPPVEVDKGTTLRGLVVEHQLEGVLYIGDDTTDVAALEAARDLRAAGQCEAWGIGVQSEEMPEEVEETADFSVSGVGGVEELLDWLLTARRASST
ncbi:MAG: trehalose-phosphatase [Chloroflexi bacterium]|nr:trehalose-phosphatase [Chloroflexota bacterium]MQC26144.1 trehalose-phosphatase [Chloroflexota bacterium]